MWLEEDVCLDPWFAQRLNPILAFQIISYSSLIRHPGFVMTQTTTRGGSGAHFVGEGISMDPLVSMGAPKGRK